MCEFIGLYSIRNMLQLFSFFFFNDTATTEIYTLSLHDALPISTRSWCTPPATYSSGSPTTDAARSEEHTSELQSPYDLVCRLLLDKKKKKNKHIHMYKKKKNKQIKKQTTEIN